MGRDLHREIIAGLALHGRAAPAHRLLIVPGHRHRVPGALVGLKQDTELIVHTPPLRATPGVRVPGVGPGARVHRRLAKDRATQATFIAGSLSLSAPET